MSNREQADIRMPATGDCWRDEHRAELVTIIGIAHEVDSGAPMVVFTEYYAMGDRPAISVLPLGAFLSRDPYAVGQRCEPRFDYRHGLHGRWCAYIAPPDPRYNMAYLSDDHRGRMWLDVKLDAKVAA